MKGIIFPLFFLFFLTACDSPLLNHEKVSKYQQDRTDSVVEGVYLPKLNIWVAFRWVEGPFGNPTKASVFELQLYNEDGTPQSLDDSISIIHYGWMPDMGHGTADDGVLQMVGPGHYQVTDMYFNMPGFWNVHILFRDGNEVIDEVVLPFQL